MDSIKNVLSAIKELTDKMGYPPTVREIADESFLTLSVAHRHLNQLRLQGKISWIPNSSRTIQLVKRGDHHESK